MSIRWGNWGPTWVRLNQRSTSVKHMQWMWFRTEGSSTVLMVRSPTPPVLFVLLSTPVLCITDETVMVSSSTKCCSPITRNHHCSLNKLFDQKTFSSWNSSNRNLKVPVAFSYWFHPVSFFLFFSTLTVTSDTPISRSNVRCFTLQILVPSLITYSKMSPVSSVHLSTALCLGHKVADALECATYRDFLGIEKKHPWTELHHLKVPGEISWDRKGVMVFLWFVCTNKCKKNLDVPSTISSKLSNHMSSFSHHAKLVLALACQNAKSSQLWQFDFLHFWLWCGRNISPNQIIFVPNLNHGAVRPENTFTFGFCVFVHLITVDTQVVLPCSSALYIFSTALSSFCTFNTTDIICVCVCVCYVK